MLHSLLCLMYNVFNCVWNLYLSSVNDAFLFRFLIIATLVLSTIRDISGISYVNHGMMGHTLTWKLSVYFCFFHQQSLPVCTDSYRSVSTLRFIIPGIAGLSREESIKRRWLNHTSIIYLHTQYIFTDRTRMCESGCL